MALSITYFILGLVVLIAGADRFVAGAAALARRLGLPAILVGLTIVALGTSAPEIVVAIMASAKGEPMLAIGGAIGSNIANVGLVLGCSALFAPLRIESLTLRREYPVLLLVTLLVIALLMDGYFSRIDGIILLMALFSLLIISILYALRMRKQYNKIPSNYRQGNGSTDITQTNSNNNNSNNNHDKKMSYLWISIWLIVGGIAIPLSSEFVIQGAVGIARHFGISELLIGLTILAIGTSLPELATALIGIAKGEHDISIGNILGSNIFNLIAVLPFPGLIHPTALSEQLIYRDLPVLLGSTLAVYVVAFSIRGQGRVTRLEGAALLLCYIGFITYLIYSS